MMTIISEISRGLKKRTGSAVSVKVVRRCPFCGLPLYEKLGNCDGEIQIKCPKCGKFVTMNLALRTARG
jgi:phage FluMu protein Com